MEPRSRLVTISLVAVLVLIWGLSWPVYKYALSYTPPILFAGMRTFLGGLALALVALPRWNKIRFRTHARIYFTSAFFNVFLFFGLQTVGLTYMPGGLFSVIVYLQPVLVSLLAWFWVGESMSVFKLTGLVLGFAGVFVVSSDGFSGEISAWGIFLALITAISWAIGAVYLKKNGNSVDPLWLVAIQSMTGGLALTLIGTAVESWSDIVWNLPYLSGLLFGMLLGVPTAWVVYFVLVRSGEAGKVAANTFSVPFISVAAGTLLLGEPFHFKLFLGLVLIAASIYLVNRRTAKDSRSAVSSSAGTVDHL